MTGLLFTPVFQVSQKRISECLGCAVKPQTLLPCGLAKD